MDAVGTTDDRYTAAQYFQLVAETILQPDDHVELLDGVIVTVPPSGPSHASVVGQVAQVLTLAVVPQAAVRVQLPLIAGTHSVPEPDVAVVTGTHRDYRSAHPTSALLAVEVSDRSLPQDRLTKTRIYAAARIPEYWIINLREGCAEVLRAPNPVTRAYDERRVAHRGERLTVMALPGVSITVDELLAGCPLPTHQAGYDPLRPRH
jgi:Uma2 family endonuclease